MADNAGRRAERLKLRGHVQGVGFRPFVYRLAQEHGVHGYVQNQLGEVEIIACGDAPGLERFQRDLIERAPPLSRPELIFRAPAEANGFTRFDISKSAGATDAQVFIPPDYFMCDDCRRELNDPHDRRYRYPFINCTQCGPRYTLIESLPYDRPNTSMAGFELCTACREEYEDPADRRFHAEPVACPDCGPALAFHAADEMPVSNAESALSAAVDWLCRGRVVAVKGVGGYHLMCDAENERAVAELRRRKHRPAKPLAVMYPLAGEDGLDRLRRDAYVDEATAERLKSAERPIVLSPKTTSFSLAPNVADGLAEIGVFLPYAPLQDLLLSAVERPLVATSGNISGEPVLTGNAEARTRLSGIADGFLDHDRPIVRPADDSVYRKIGGALRPLRLGRGAAPRELSSPWRQARPTLAVGGHMKATLALSFDDRVVVSPHIGEMDTPRSLAVFEQVAADLQALYGIEAERIVCDAHRGYTTHRWAGEQRLPVETVWHHHAHASALAAEHADALGDGHWLTFTWDGVGLGEDGSLWGGEALLGRPGDWRRVASLRPFRLPGGDRAGREPWRSAAALLWEAGEDFSPSADPDGLSLAAWKRRINCPRSTGAGRVFDAAAALILGTEDVSFEAEGPMRLEALCRQRRDPIPLPLSPDGSGLIRSDWAPLLSLLQDAGRGTAERAEIFHASMAQLITDQAIALREIHAFDRIGLTGGVFQNRFLVDDCIARLASAGFDVHLARELPCNDAAISFGQAAELAAREQEGRHDR